MKRFLILALLLALPAGAQTLKEDTAHTIMVGPLVDSVDATAETALTISQADVRLSKNGGNMAQKSDTGSCTHDELGMYACPLNATDTDIPGVLTVTIGEAGTLVWSRDYQVVGASFYDLMAGTQPLLTSRMTGLALDTTIDTLVDGNSFTTVDGASNDDAYEDMSVTVVDESSGEEGENVVLNYVASTNTFDLQFAVPFTLEVGDRVYVRSAPSATQVSNIRSLAAVSGVALANDSITDASVDDNITELGSGAGNVELTRGLLDTTIATLTDQDTFTLTDGSSDNGAYDGCGIVITDQATADQIARSQVLSYTGSSKTVQLLYNPDVFTMAVGDLVTISCLLGR